MPVIVTITGTDCQPHELMSTMTTTTTMMSSASDDESPAAVDNAAAATVPASGSARAQWAAAAGADLTGTVTLPLAVAAQSRSHWNIWRVLSPLSESRTLLRPAWESKWRGTLGTQTGE
jgi:hypothetical protein